MLVANNFISNFSNGFIGASDGDNKESLNRLKEFRRLSKWVLGLSLVFGIIATVAGYGIDQWLSMPALVFAHILIVLSATSFKIGYLMHFIADLELKKIAQ